MQAASVPALEPQTPPVAVRPATEPETVQAVTKPLASFRPTRPPTWLLALTAPVKEQAVTAPRLRPTSPPTMLSSPRGATVPLRFRATTLASGPVSRKKPQGDWALVRFRS